MTPREPIADADAVPAARSDETCDRSMTTGQDHRPLDPAATTDGAAPEHPAEIGRYSIRRLLGRGAMGAVYLAHDPELDRAVALKVPRLTSPESQERFLREARAAAAVSHPNLCPVHDAGRADGGLYLAMAYVPGSTLTEVLREDGPLPPALAAAIATGVARGMAEAHRHGIIHRDLKPGNILMNPRGEPVVTDFGLARRSGTADLGTDPNTTFAHDPRLTQAGIVMGTPAYMPPEQARGDLDRVGPVSDVYALGAILFEMLTGEPPFRAPTVPELLRKLETQPAPVPSASNAAVPVGLDAVCAKALAKQPAERFESMEAFAAALAPFAGGVRRRRWGRIAAAAAAFILLLVAGTIIYVKTDNGTIEVRLNDPNADVQVTVDGEEVTLTENGRTTKLRAGPHMLTVKGPNYETETKLLKVTRGDKTVVEVELKPKAPVAAAPKIVPKVEPKPAPKVTSPNPNALTPEQARLASLLARGRQLIRQNKYGELGPIADEALRIDAESPGALALRATFRMSIGDIPAAQSDIDAALKLNPDTVQALMLKSYFFGESAKYDEAIAESTIALRVEPKNAAIWENRALFYFRKDEYRQAVRDATQALELHPKLISALLTRSAASAVLGDYDKALDDLAVIVAGESTVPGVVMQRVYMQRSAIFVRMGDDAAAAADWDKALELNKSLLPKNRPVFPIPPKREPRKKLTASEANDWQGKVLMAEMALAQDRFDDALLLIDEAIRIDPTSSRVYSLRGRVFAEVGKYPDALAAANEAIRLDPADAWAHTIRGGVKYSRSDYAGAIADHTIAVALNPNLSNAWYHRGNSYSRTRRHDQAFADHNESLRLNDRSADAHASRGACYLHFGDYGKALADYERAHELEPSPRWLLLTAVIRTKLKDLPGAERDHKAAIALDPKLKNAAAPKLPPVLPPVKRDPELP